MFMWGSYCRNVGYFSARPFDMEAIELCLSGVMLWERNLYC